MRNPFGYFNSSPEVIRLVVMMYIRYPLSLRQVEDILFERGIDICHETQARSGLSDNAQLSELKGALVRQSLYSQSLTGRLIRTTGVGSRNRWCRKKDVREI